MRVRRELRFCLMAAAAFVGCGSGLRAQSPPQVERCVPYPTLAHEIEDMRAGFGAGQAGSDKEVRITELEFRNKTPLPGDLEEQISAWLRSDKMRWSDNTNTVDYLNEMADVGVRSILQDNGYFRVTADVHLTDLVETKDHYEIGAAILTDLGPQYRVVGIHFRSAGSAPLFFSPAVLRSMMPIQDGDVLDESAIRSGLKQIAAIYGHIGFIDTTMSPEFAINDRSHLVSLTLAVDEQKPYRVGKIQILGVPEALKGRLLEALPQPGEFFDSRRVHDFFKENRKLLPANASEPNDEKLIRNTEAGLVDIQLDFRTCPDGQDQQTTF